MPYYEAPEMLMEHLKYWDKYPEWSYEYLELIIVDDGSSHSPAGDVLDSVGHPRFPFRVFKIQDDIPWNHGGARNITEQHGKRTKVKIRLIKLTGLLVD